MDINTVINKIASNYCTIMIVDDAGDIKELVELETNPTPEVIVSIAVKYKDKSSGSKIIRRSKLTREQLEKIINDIVEAIKWSRNNDTKPGINIPNKKNKWWK
jgi:hypothetical protein